MIAGIWAALLSPFTNSYLLAAVGGAGFSVATIETYKTFFFPNRPRGKFAGKPIAFPEHLVTRQRFIPLYAGIWTVVLDRLRARLPRAVTAGQSARPGGYCAP